MAGGVWVFLLIVINKFKLRERRNEVSRDEMWLFP